MPFDLDPTYAIYGLAAISAALVAEACYLLLFSVTSYRSRVNRRLSLLKDQPDRQNVFVQLRRERGLTSGGEFRLPIQTLNRLILQSGLSLGITRLGVIVAVATAIGFGADLFAR